MIKRITNRPTPTRRIALAALLGAAAAAHATDHTLIVLSGTEAPGMPGVVFDFLSSPRINSSGQIAFWAELAGPGITEDNAQTIWQLDPGGTMTLFRRQGDESPVSGHHYGALPTFAFNNVGGQGQYAFTASLVETGAPSHSTLLGMFTTDSTGPGLITLAVEGEPATGLPGVEWSSLPLPHLATYSPRKATAFSANNGRGLWRFAGGQLNLQNASGAGAPGSPLEFSFLNDPRLGARGDFAFHATLRTAGSTQPTSSGVFHSIIDQTEALALEGQQAPGLPTGVEFTEFSAQPASSLSDAAFWARITGPGITSENDTGIWQRTGGNLELLTRAGDQAPGTEPGTVFASFARQVAIAPTSPSSTIAFLAYLDGPGITPENNSGIWMQSSNGSLSLLVREGQHAPRMPGGTEFAMLGPVHVNVRGQIAFTAFLRGNAVSPTDNFALFATDTHGRITPIIRRGDEIDVNGSPRIVSDILFDSSAPGTGQSQFVSINREGRLIYKLRFISQPPEVLQALFTSTIGCYANCDGSTTEPVLTVDDFTCFINAFAQAQSLPVAQQIAHYANCDGSTTEPVLTVDDFTCFINAFAAGCS